MPTLADVLYEPATPANMHRAHQAVVDATLEAVNMGILPEGPRPAPALPAPPPPPPPRRYEADLMAEAMERAEMAPAGALLPGTGGTGGAATNIGTFTLTTPPLTMFAPGAMAINVTSGITTGSSTFTFQVPAGLDLAPMMAGLQTAINNVCTVTTQMTTNGTIMATITQVWNEWNQAYIRQQGTAANTWGTTNCTTYGDAGWWDNSKANYAELIASRAAWGVWNDRYEQISEAKVDADRIQRYSRRRLSEAELIAELNKEKAARRAAEEAARIAREAEGKAEKLLRTCLTREQIEDLEKKRCFYVEVEGRTPGRKERYRIERDSHIVKQLDEKGSIIRTFCIYVPGVPHPDTMLAQKLFLEGSEETREEFWATANIGSERAEKIIPHTVPKRERRRYAEQHGLLH